MRNPLILVCSITMLLGIATTPADAQPSLAKARELYAAAAYDEALAALDALLPPEQQQEGETRALYRVLCLVALGRTGDAEAAIETLVTDHPLYRPPTDELSPRMRTALTTARKRLLPEIIQTRYAHAKAAYERGDFVTASTTFKWVLQAVGDSEIAHAAAHPPLSDLRTLAAGFRDLSDKAMAPPPPPPAPVVVPPPAPTRDYRRLYAMGETDVVPPVTVKQALPRFPGRMTEAAEGVLEIIVDAMGSVESARMVDPVHPQYDGLALSAAKKWQYQPARVDDVPVRFLKRVHITLEPTP
jgi:TonB family protein